MIEDDRSIGESFYLRGDYEEAVAAWERSESGTEGFEHHYRKGVALRKLGRYEEAVRVLETALSLNPESADAWRTMPWH
jgi:tetratricopeptide (TPR) repeat protein